MSLANQQIAVVIPCYKVKQHIEQVITQIPDFIDAIYIIDDACPDQSGEYILKKISHPKLHVLKNLKNLGVGGAVVQGYKKAISDKMDIIVKIDGDGQMNPKLIQDLINPLLHNHADYVKGNRFHRPSNLGGMPLIRLLGNTMLSFINKIVTGYWDIMDPTNGFTAISLVALKEIPLEKISHRYFFESDMLFRLSLAKAKVVDFPMKAKYEDEKSHLRISQTVIGFPPRYFQRFIKRIFYQYFLRDFNFGSLSLISGIPLFLFGSIYGLVGFYNYSIVQNSPAPTGRVVIPSMLIILGTQFIISFLQYDINAYPKNSISSKN